MITLFGQTFSSREEAKRMTSRLEGMKIGKDHPMFSWFSQVANVEPKHVASFKVIKGNLVRSSLAGKSTILQVHKTTGDVVEKNLYRDITDCFDKLRDKDLMPMDAAQVPDPRQVAMIEEANRKKEEIKKELNALNTLAKDLAARLERLTNLVQ